MTKVIIIGGSYAATKAAKLTLEIDPIVEVTMVTPSSSVFFNVASPRALIESNMVDQLIIPLKKVLGSTLYERCTIVNDFADSVDLAAKTVTTKSGEVLVFDYLIVASGSQSKSPAFKMNGDCETSKTTLLSYASRLSSSGTVGIVGGGVTGVEVAGEIGSLGTKKVTLISGGVSPMSAISKLSEKAAKKLKDLNVEIINDLKVQNFDENLVNLSNGTTLQFDLVIPTFGNKPNSHFLPASVLDDKGFVVVDSHLMVKGYGNVLAFGDIADIGDNTLIEIDKRQVPVLKATLGHLFKGTNLVEYNENKMKDTIIIPISRDGGVGMISGWSVPNFIVRMLKSKTFFVDRAASIF